MKRQSSASTALRARVLAVAMEVSAREGLAGMSIGQVATASSRFKSGITGLFGSKEGLQLALLAEAQNRFVDAVLRPAEQRAGIEQLQVLADGWIQCCLGGVFPHGCFLLASLHEMDGRPGRVRDAVGAFNALVHKAIADAAGPCLGDSDLTAQDVVARVVGIGAAVNFLVIAGHRDRALRDGQEALARLLRELSPPASDKAMMRTCVPQASGATQRAAVATSTA